MAYVPIEYPKVLYGTDGMPVTVKNAAAAAQLPATFAAVPTVADPMVAIRVVAKAAIVTMAAAVAATNVPTVNKRKLRGDH